MIIKALFALACLSHLAAGLIAARNPSMPMAQNAARLFFLGVALTIAALVGFLIEVNA